MNRYEILVTNDNSFTIKDHVIDETFHSIAGALSESLHVYINNGLNVFKDSTEIKIFEMGFGTGLNTLLTLINKLQNQYIYYESIDLYPLSKNYFPQLLSVFKNDEQHTYKKILEAEWNKTVQITKSFVLKKISADIIDHHFDRTFNLVYYDAFSPCKMPHLWSIEIFNKLYKATEPEGIIVTYACSGMVKHNLKSAGFSIERLKGFPPKKHILRAKKY